MENKLGPELVERLFHALIVLNIAHKEFNLRVRVITLHLNRHVVHGCLGLVDKHDAAGLISRHLSHNLTTDRATSTRNEHTRAFDGVAHQGVIEHDGIAS